MKPLIVRRFRLQLVAGKLARRCERGPLCGVRGCEEFGDSCWLPDGSEEFYCSAHMRDVGFCPGCHQFWAGIESFDFSRSGYCENCAVEFDDDDWDDDDWDDDLTDWDDYPHMQVMQ